MDLFLDSAPFGACLAIHLGGFIAAWLNRLMVGFWATIGLRALLLAFLVPIGGLALQARADAFHLWSLSAITIAAMVVTLIHHGERDSHDPVLSRLLASGE